MSRKRTRNKSSPVSKANNEHYHKSRRIAKQKQKAKMESNGSHNNSPGPSPSTSNLPGIEQGPDLKQLQNGQNDQNFTIFTGQPFNPDQVTFQQPFINQPGSNSYTQPPYGQQIRIEYKSGLFLSEWYSESVLDKPLNNVAVLLLLLLLIHAPQKCFTPDWPLIENHESILSHLGCARMYSFTSSRGVTR